MSSGDSEAAPTYYFSGITFNPTFYSATSGNYLTLATAKNIFLTYPLAQGTETISTLYSSTIEASTTDFSIVPSQTTGILNIGSNSSTATRTTGAINIGTNVVGNTPIVIGMAGKSTTALRGTSVDVATKLTSSVYDSTNESTPMTLGSNLTTAGLTIGGDQTGTNGFIKLGVTQTTGTLEIASSATRTGSLYINSTTGATNSVYLGAVGTTTVIDGATLKLGSVVSAVKINGSLTVGTTSTTPASITSAGAITGTSLVLGTGAISTVGNITSTGTIKMDTLDSTVTTSSMTIGNLMTSATTLTIGNNALIKMKSPAITNTGSTPVTQAATTMTMYGGLMYSYVGAAYTIPASGTINRDFYIVVVGSGTFTITMPAIAIHQIIHIRNQNASPINLTAPLAGTRFYPTQTGGGLSTTTFSMPANTAQHFYCDGLDWQGI